MIDVTAPGFSMKLINLDAIMPEDIKPLPGRVVQEEEGLYRELHAAAARNAKRKTILAASAVHPAIQTAVSAAKARCDAIHAMTPKGAEQLAYSAMRDGTTVEQFKAILADFQATRAVGAKDDGDEAEATAQAILAAARKAQGEDENQNGGDQ